MDLRQILIIGAGAGVALVCAGSLLLAGRRESAQLLALDERVSAIGVRAAKPARAPSLHLLAAAPPLFPFAGDAGVSEAVIRLEGVARTPERMAALVSINGTSSAWLGLGETREGVTLQAVRADGATFDTALGERAVAFGQAPAAPTVGGGAASVASAALSAPAPESPLPELRRPPEPANAPGAVRR